LGGGENIVNGRIAMGGRQIICRVAMRAIKPTMPILGFCFIIFKAYYKMILPLWKFQKDNY